MSKYLLALDQGTTSSRAILFDLAGKIVSSAQYEFRQIYPGAGYVEHDPFDILETQKQAAADVLRRTNIQPGEIAAVGVTNQRETTIVWDKTTGKPVYNAIVWQCRRTAPLCETLIAEGWSDYVQKTTGLLIDAYFSGTKIRYILDHIENGQTRAENGELLFGTVDTWLIWNLTGEHVTDYSNASRTMLFNIHTLEYDDQLLKRLNIPRCMLPKALPSSHVYGVIQPHILDLEVLGDVPLAGAAGDQQAALFGQACFEKGMAKCTYGTGGFLMMNTGTEPIASQNRLLTTIAWGVNGRVEYALEGSIFNAGSSIKWLRDDLGLVSSAREVDVLAESVPDAGGAYFVSAFTGLGAPHWDMYARGAMLGLTRGTTKAHIARAVLEGIAYQVRDLAITMEKDAGIPLSELKVDGGASVSNIMMQIQSDLLNTRVNRPRCVESTALGAACLAGLATGVFQSTADIAAKWESERIFVPKIDEAEREKRLSGWRRALERAKGWEEK
ncbi:MAG: glycerol kinase GlpK [Eubacteriales bacterium]|nr:glycerol kinase GlpK [Eubacteriales bacterium]